MFSHDFKAFETGLPRHTIRVLAMGSVRFATEIHQANYLLCENQDCFKRNHLIPSFMFCKLSTRACVLDMLFIVSRQFYLRAVFLKKESEIPFYSKNNI